MGYDGRTDKHTRAMVADSSGKPKMRMVTEENESLTDEPSGRYLSHFTPETPVHPEKPALEVAQGLFNILEQHNSTDSIQFLARDSTNMNTGWKGGGQALLKKLLGRRLYWGICPLHTNVLPLAPENVVNALSTDSQMCYKLVAAVKSGHLPNVMQEMHCGPLCYASWFTNVQRIFFLWTRKHGLTGENLKTHNLLVRFCLDFYLKLFFDIKVKHHIMDAPYHILTELRILKKQPKKVKYAVTLYVRTGAWYEHPECLLVFFLASNTMLDREFAIKQIMKLRGNSEFRDDSLRPRITSKLNLSARPHNMSHVKCHVSHVIQGVFFFCPPP